MLKRGHIGLTLALASPLAVGIGFFSKPIALAVVAGAVAGGALPDMDTQTGLVKHRGFTHTVWFSILAGISITGIIAVGLLQLPPSEFIPVPNEATRILFGSAFGIGIVYGTLTHLIGDVITPRGIKPFDPISPRNIIPITISDKKYTYEIANASNKSLNNVASAAGVFLVGIAVVALLNI